MSPEQHPEVGDVVAWRRAGAGWAYGIVESPGRVSAAVRVIAGAPSKTASRPYSGLVLVLTSSTFIGGLDQCLQQALAALDGDGPGASRGRTS